MAALPASMNAASTSCSAPVNMKEALAAEVTGEADGDGADIARLERGVSAPERRGHTIGLEHTERVEWGRAARPDRIAEQVIVRVREEHDVDEGVSPATALPAPRDSMTSSTPPRTRIVYLPGCVLPAWTRRTWAFFTTGVTADDAACDRAEFDAAPGPVRTTIRRCGRRP
jgi:hypothetical protein